MHSYAPLVRGHLDPLSPLRESLDLPALLVAYMQGQPVAEILPTPLRDAVIPERIEVCAVAGGRVLLMLNQVDEAGVRGDELDALSADGGGVRLAPVHVDEAERRVRSGATLVLLGVDEVGTLHLALIDEEAKKGTGKAGAAGIGAISDPAKECGTVTRWESLRTVGHLLSDDDTQRALVATALAAWHEQMRFCPACGQRPEPWACGWVRRCPACGHMEYPRQDPAVIMTVVDRHDRVLLAHNRAWSERRVSVLAGFVDAGEAPERAVIREVWEEVGLRVAEVEAVATQPWPFPRSLMLGYHARLEEGLETSSGGDAVSALDCESVSPRCAVPSPDGTEIEWANFYSRDELIEAVRSGEIILPGPSTIAHGLLRRWFGGALPGYE